MDRSGTVIGVQYLRGLAALFVAIDHCAGMMAFPEYFAAAPSDRLAYGYIGVPIFFVISGFIIAAVSLNADLTPRLKLRDFASKRLVRIVPFMWVCIAIYAVVRSAGTGKGVDAETLKAFVLWPIGELRPNVLWTLRHEAIFYALFAATVLVSWRRLPWLVAWFVSPAAIWILDHAAPGWSGSIGAPWVDLVRLLFNPVNIQFGAGFALGALYLTRSRLLATRLQVGAFGTLVAASLAFAMAAFFKLDKVGFEYLAVGALATVVVWLAIQVRPEPTSWLARLLALLGNASYAIYLVHNLALLVMLSAFSKFSWKPNLWAAESVMVVCSVAAGVAAHKLLEQPLLAALRSRAARPVPGVS